MTADRGPSRSRRRRDRAASTSPRPPTRSRCWSSATARAAAVRRPRPRRPGAPAARAGDHGAAVRAAVARRGAKGRRAPAAARRGLARRRGGCARAAVGPGLPLVLGGRSAGARVACRTATGAGCGGRGVPGLPAAPARPPGKLAAGRAAHARPSRGWCSRAPATRSARPLRSRRRWSPGTGRAEEVRRRRAARRRPRRPGGHRRVTRRRRAAGAGRGHDRGIRPELVGQPAAEGPVDGAPVPEGIADPASR